MFVFVIKLFGSVCYSVVLLF